jgi:hypothetical protein
MYVINRLSVCLFQFQAHFEIIKTSADKSELCDSHWKTRLLLYIPSTRLASGYLSGHLFCQMQRISLWNDAIQHSSCCVQKDTRCESRPGLIPRWDTLQCQQVALCPLCAACTGDWTVSCFVVSACRQRIGVGHDMFLAGGQSLHFNIVLYLAPSAAILHVTLSAILTCSPHPKLLPVATSACHSVCDLWLSKLLLNCNLY